MNVLLNKLVDWMIGQSILEVAGVITGLSCVYLAAKNKIWNWPIGIINVSIYTFIFLQAKLYADMGLQLYFLAMNIYGWYFWSRPSQARTQVPVRKISKREIWGSSISIIIFTTFSGFFLKHETDASFPWVDSFCTACSLLAQFLLARKVLENWLIWIFVDIIYVGVFLIKDLNLTAAMYAFFIYIAVLGYLTWNKEYRIQEIRS